MINISNKEQEVMFSIIIPTYNEASKKNNMKNNLKDIKKYFENLRQKYEIIIVLDGPTDGQTENIVKEIAQQNSAIRIIDRKENKGKGYSVREGLMKAKGKIRLFTDMDGATPIEMFDRFLPEFENGADIVIGSRDLKDSDVAIHQPKWKEWLGDFGNLFIQFIGGLWGIKDTQCGFKAFTKEAVQNIIPRTTVNRWGIDFELLIIGKKLGYTIKEVPVKWLDRGASLVGLSGYISTFRDLFKVKWNLIKGIYKISTVKNSDSE